MDQIAIYIYISWYSKICWFPVKKCWCQHNSRGVSRDFYIFLFHLYIKYAFFIIIWYVWQILRRWGRGSFCPQCHQWAASKKGPSWIELNEFVFRTAGPYKSLHLYYDPEKLSQICLQAFLSQNSINVNLIALCWSFNKKQKWRSVWSCII